MLVDLVLSLELELALGLELGVLLELELELGLLALGLALEPEAALPDGLLELAPPLAWSFFESDDIELEAEPDGEDGEVVEPADDEAEPEGEEVEPEGAVEVLRDAARSPVLSHAVSITEPRATETAIARVLNLMWPPWLGYSGQAARFGPTCWSGSPCAGPAPWDRPGPAADCGPLSSPACSGYRRWPEYVASATSARLRFAERRSSPTKPDDCLLGRTPKGKRETMRPAKLS